MDNVWTDCFRDLRCALARTALPPLLLILVACQGCQFKTCTTYHINPQMLSPALPSEPTGQQVCQTQE